MSARISLKLRDNQERQCGPCQECCVALTVEDLSKATWEKCSHQCEIGCDIYHDTSRPVACREYHCLWQAGMLEGDESMRPDNLGIILDLGLDPIPGVFMMRGFEVREGAADEPEADDLLKALASNSIIGLKRYKSSIRRVYGPERMVREEVEQNGSQSN